MTGIASVCLVQMRSSDLPVQAAERALEDTAALHRPRCLLDWPALEAGTYDS